MPGPYLYESWIRERIAQEEPEANTVSLDSGHLGKRGSSTAALPALALRNRRAPCHDGPVVACQTPVTSPVTLVVHLHPAYLP